MHAAGVIELPFNYSGCLAAYHFGVVSPTESYVEWPWISANTFPSEVPVNVHEVASTTGSSSKFPIDWTT